jgi:cytochrome c nitrite reductase small subunit
LGVGFFTFGYAQGLSYFSSDPRACANCHIMNDQYASWQKGPHHGDAVCVDCHLPHTGVAKLMAKASNGYHHSKGFTLQDFHEPIMIKPGNARILQDNCLRCHGDFVHDVVAGSTTDRNAVLCVHCHRGVGHGARG